MGTHEMWPKNICGCRSKGYESFGNTISKELKDVIEYQKKHKTTKRKKRIDDLCDTYLNGKNYNELRYQLLYYLAGTISEPNQDIYIMLVIVFKEKDKFDEKKLEKNKQDFENFMKCVGVKTDYGYDLSKIKPNTFACYIEIEAN